MAWRLFGAKPSPKPVVIIHHLDPYEQTFFKLLGERLETIILSRRGDLLSRCAEITVAATR